MKEPLPTAGRRYSQFVGALACACSIAYLQWCLNRNSAGPFENRLLVRYLLIDMTCFLVLFFAIKFLLSYDATRFLSSLILAALGALCSSLLIDLPFILNSFGYREIAEGHSAGAVQTIVAACAINIFVASVVMSFVCGVAAIARSVQSNLALHRGGI
jgi:hypothetical protein